MFDCTLESLSEVVRHMGKRIDSLEANQRNAESGTTGCSAGRMPELSTENRPVQPAGNPLDSLEEFETWIRAGEEDVNEAEDEDDEFDMQDTNRFLDRVLALIRTYRSQGAA